MNDEPIEPERLPERPATPAAPMPAPGAPGMTSTWLTPGRRRMAWMIALAVDALQIAIFPLLGFGAASPLMNGIDIVTGILLWRLIGWHLAFLPTFVAELLPFVDLFPTWTLAVAFVMRGKK